MDLLTKTVILIFLSVVVEMKNSQDTQEHTIQTKALYEQLELTSSEVH